MKPVDTRPVSQQIAHQTVAGCGIFFIIIPFAILVIAGAICLSSSPEDTRSKEEIQRDYKKWAEQYNVNQNINSSSNQPTPSPRR